MVQDWRSRVSLSLLTVTIGLLVASLADAAASTNQSEQLPSRKNYFGSFIGKLASSQPDRFLVSGEVYAVDEQTLFIRGLNYDGQAPDAYFWSSVTSAHPGASNGQDGFIVPDEKGSTKPLERYVNKDVVLRLPEGKTLREIQWLSIWSTQLKMSVGDILISRRELIIPRPLEIPAFSQLAHGLRSGPITIVDAQTFLVPDFHYDGQGPDAYFWLSRGGSGLSASNSLRLKDENGLSSPLRKYQGETIVISLPDELTIYDFDFFGVWCKQFASNFGQTQLPRMARVPPSPKMLGIKPENKLNCEILYDDLGFELRWVLDGDDIVMQLVGRIEPGEYMAFGLGKNDSQSAMNNADAVVAWVDRPTGQVHATDYFLGGKQQCVNDPKGGSCPDVKLANGSDSLTLLHGAIVNGYSMVTFKRPQLGVDELYDQHVYSDGQQSVVWAIGALNERREIGYHRLRTSSNMFIDFARNPQWNCPIPDLNASMHNNLPITSASQLDQTVVSASSSPAAELNADELQPISSAAGQDRRQTGPPQQEQQQEQLQPWFIPQVVCPKDRSFYAQIGPTGGKRGYAALTGRTNWIPPASWYINGLLVPELVVERGQTYRFLVEGGNDKTSAGRRHPLYLTDSPEGGFYFKTDEERMRERIFGGVAMRASDGQFVPTAEGRLCEWKPTSATLASPDLHRNFASYQRSLKLDCLPGQASVLTFTPDANTPDLLYYQCYTSRLMGWRIRVVDSCGDYMKAQSNQLKQQQMAAQSSNISERELADIRDERAAAKLARRKPVARSADTLDRRHSNSGPVDLEDMVKPQASEQRAFSLEVPPSGTNNGHSAQHLFGPDPDQLASFLQSPGGFEFGDELAASDELPSGPYSTATSQVGSQLLLLNNSFLRHADSSSDGGGTSSRFNLSTIEQILKLSPSDLEFLDDTQLDLVSAVALASSANPQLLLQNTRQPIPMPLNKYLGEERRQNKTSTDRPPSKPFGTRMPKSLHNYARRLASIYYPMQQQLASMLSLNNAPHIPPANSNNLNQQQMLAQLHQQIVAASTLVPPPISQSGGATNSNANKQRTNEPATAASSQTSGFSLASLVPKPKIDLSKSNLGKKFNRLRGKTGRKLEPQSQQQQQQSSQLATSASSNQIAKRPPTPDNEFNYDIFNDQLNQLEKHREQLHNFESFAAALSAASNNVNSWPSQMPQWPGPQLNSQPDSAFSYSPMTSQSNKQVRPVEQLMFSASSSPSSTLFEQHQHLVEPLQQQQSSLNLLEQFENEQPDTNREPNQQAVFVTKIAQQTLNMPTPSLRQQFGRAPLNWHQGVHLKLNPQPHSQPQQHQYQHHDQQAPSRQLPSYLDSTDYNAIRQSSPAPSQPQQQLQKQLTDSTQPSEISKQSNEHLSGSGGTIQHIIRSHNWHLPTEQTTSGELDHMLAIERYSKQSPERGPPSVHGHESNLRQDPSRQHSQNHTQVMPFSPKLIDIEGSKLSEPSSITTTAIQPPRPDGDPNHPVTHAEILDSEQSVRAADSRRLNASEHEAVLASSASGGQRHQQQTTTDLPNVLSRPASVLDFFASDPPATATSAYSTPLPPISTSTQVMPFTNSAAGPLVPSMLPMQQQQQSSNHRATGELVLRTNLIEPIKSTLVPNQSYQQQHQQGPFAPPSGSSLVSSPFTPIEVSPVTQPTRESTSPASPFGNYQQQVASSTLQTARIRPPPLVESMLSQYRSPFRPEPPVRVASYLARHLASSVPSQPQGQHHDSNELAASSSAPAPVRTSDPQRAIDSSNSNGQLNSSASGRQSPDLIILKPSMLNHWTPQTYALRPEYLTTVTHHQQQPFRPLFSDVSANNVEQLFDGAGSSPNSELLLSGELAARRLASHQFDRLSSLSSPPTTSMLLEPMQVPTSVQSYDVLHRQNDPLQTTKLTSLPLERGAAPTTSEITTTTRKAPEQQQQKEPKSEFNILQRDNSTDNAILSHVMSLIYSNAVPTPPLIPMAGIYSSADYFLPVSDQHNQGQNLLETRSIRS